MWLVVGLVVVGVMMLGKVGELNRGLYEAFLETLNGLFLELNGLGVMDGLPLELMCENYGVMDSDFWLRLSLGDDEREFRLSGVESGVVKFSYLDACYRSRMNSTFVQYFTVRVDLARVDSFEFLVELFDGRDWGLVVDRGEVLRFETRKGHMVNFVDVGGLVVEVIRKSWVGKLVVQEAMDV